MSCPNLTFPVERALQGEVGGLHLQLKQLRRLTGATLGRKSEFMNWLDKIQNPVASSSSDPNTGETGRCVRFWNTKGYREGEVVYFPDCSFKNVILQVMSNCLVFRHAVTIHLTRGNEARKILT